MSNKLLTIKKLITPNVSYVSELWSQRSLVYTVGGDDRCILELLARTLATLNASTYYVYSVSESSTARDSEITCSLK